MTATITPTFPAALTPNALDVLKHRPYLQPNETPDQMFMRVANHIASAEGEEKKSVWAEAFYRLMASLDFLPNTPTLVHAGVPNHDSHCLSACFVLPIYDSLLSIMTSLRDAALIEKSGGGTGFSFSRIRSKGSPIGSVPGGALGPVEVLKVYSRALEALTQGAVRHGAHMGQLSVDHPDILEFIQAKDEERVGLANFNISVQVTDKFMKKVERDDWWDLVDPHSGQVVKQVLAKELWRAIIISAHKTGDPGIAFIDRVKETEPNPTLGPIEASNPCGEEFLEPYGSCNLGSINLGNFVINNGGKIDWQRLGQVVRLAVRFLDNVVTVNHMPSDVPQLRGVNLQTRRIGLGVMGWADLLDQLYIPYDSDEAIEIAKGLSAFITKKAWEESGYLAEIKGPFPLHDRAKLKLPEGIEKTRNSSVTTIAPTGSISLIAGCSSGIEPHFALSWTRKTLWNGTKNHTREIVEHPRFIREGHYTGSGHNDNTEHLRVANKIDYSWHVQHLAAWQSGVTNSVSKTINLPNNAAVDDVSRAFRMAWGLRCKAVTVYRDGSKEVQVLNHNGKEGEKGLIMGEDVCPNCKGSDIKREGRCFECLDCGQTSCYR